MAICRCILLLIAQVLWLNRLPGKEKKLFAVQGDLATNVMQIANRKGMTVYNYTNEVFEQAIKAESMNRSLGDIVEIFRLLEIERDSGAMFTTKDTFLYMVEKLYHQEKEELLKKAYESGRWYGKYLQMKFDDGEPLDLLEKLLNTCFWDSSEIHIARNEGKVTLNRLSPNDSIEYTEMIARFIEGIVNSFGYDTKSNDVSKGLISFEFGKNDPEESAYRKIGEKRIRTSVAQN